MRKFLERFILFFIVLVLLNGCAAAKPETADQPEQTEEIQEEIIEETDEFPEEEKVLIQGIIDVFWIEEDGIVSPVKK